MAKTLADMTAEERADCAGMWADVARGARAVIVNAKEQDYCWVIHPEDGGNVATCRNKMVNPRPDLPRAWTPDGEPEIEQALAEETWEYSFQIKYADGWETASNSVTEIDEWWPDKSDAEQAANSAYDPYIERPMRLVRRRVSPVEVISD